MRIPWNPIFAGVGLAIVYATDWPAIIGWGIFAFAVIGVIIQLMALLIVAPAMREFRTRLQDPEFPMNEKALLDSYKTNFGRRRPVPSKTKTNVKTRS